MALNNFVNDVQKNGHYDLDGVPVKKVAFTTIKNEDAEINICINLADRALLAKKLNMLLADAYTLYLKTQNFHWNVTGPQFLLLHTMFEKQYKSLAENIDEIAERIRSLGFRAAGTYSEFIALTTISEQVDSPTEMEMIKLLLEGYESLIRSATSIAPLSERSSDLPTADLVTKLSSSYQKNAWILRSQISAKTHPEDLI